MTTQHNPDECARLIAEARERKEWDAQAHDEGRTTSEDGYDSADYVDGWNDALDAIAEPMADQLEAAGRAYNAAVDIARAGERAIASTLVDYDNACAERDKLQAELESARKDADHWREARRAALEGGETLKAELEAARREVAEMRPVVEAGERWLGTVTLGHRSSSENALVSALHAYRAARDKAGGPAPGTCRICGALPGDRCDAGLHS